MAEERLKKSLERREVWNNRRMERREGWKEEKDGKKRRMDWDELG